jgi:hypothetical protein
MEGWDGRAWKTPGAGQLVIEPNDPVLEAGDPCDDAIQDVGLTFEQLAQEFHQR